MRLFAKNSYILPLRVGLMGEAAKCPGSGILATTSIFEAAYYGYRKHDKYSQDHCTLKSL